MYFPLLAFPIFHFFEIVIIFINTVNKVAFVVNIKLFSYGMTLL